jgi:outer membrane protein OmpA-like peptidoglycan-associated protein
LEQRFNDAHQRSDEIASLLPYIVQTLAEQTDFLSALYPCVDTCVKESFEQTPQSFVKALWPSLGPLLRRTITESVEPLDTTLQSHQTQLNESNQFRQDSERAQIKHKKQLNQLDNDFNRFKGENLKQLNQLQSAFQTLETTQLQNLEQSLDNLEKAQLNQYNQLNQIIKAFNGLKQALVKQQKRLSQSNQHFGQIAKNQQTQLANLKQRTQNLDGISVNQQTQISHLNQHIQNLDGISHHQQTHLTQIEEQLNTLETSQLHQLQKRAEQLEQVAGRFKEMEKRFHDLQQRAQDTAAILPEAIRHAVINAQASLESAPLTDSLQMPVEFCLQQSFKKDARPFADALFPLIGPSIRKSIGSAFKELLQRINTSLEQSIFSRKGLLWRFQAWRTGQSFAELVLTNTLAYRIEQVFLIHRESGLLILHSHLKEIDVGDSDAVSAMFTAIQDFIRDSFSASKEEELDSVQVGNYNVWIERGPYAILASVIRGDAPVVFRNFMQNLIEKLHSRYSSLLEQFDGDNTSLLTCQPLLEEALLTEKKAEAKAPWMTPQLALILIFILTLVSIGGYFHFEYQYRLDNYLEALHNAPGIIVASTEYQGGQLVVHGMRDPLAEEPAKIAQHFNLTEEDVLFNGHYYQDLEPQFVEQRLRLWLKPPKTVQITLRDGKLHLDGHADQAWIDKVNRSVGMMAGFSEIVAEKLVNTEEQFQTFLKTLNNTPGITIISSSTQNGRQVITGMRDPLADDPQQIAQLMQITDVDMRWTHYQDLNPQFVERRARQRLAPPPTVQLRLEGNVLHLNGHAPQAWIDKARNNANNVSGINKLEIKYLLDTDSFLLAEVKREVQPPNNISLAVHDRVLTITGHVDSATFQTLQVALKKWQEAQPELAHMDTQGLLDAEQEMRGLIQRIEKTAIYFSEGTGLMPGQEATLQNLLTEVQQLLVFSQALNQSIQLQIIGNTDGVGSQAFNQQLGQQRAEEIVNWLTQHKMKKSVLVIPPSIQIRFGESQPNPGNRNVSFKITTQE